MHSARPVPDGQTAFYRLSLGELHVHVEKLDLPACPMPFLPELELMGEKSVPMPFEFQGMERLDRYPRFDDIPADKFPLDMPVGGMYD